MKIPKLQWVIAGMLLLATMINYTDRLALSVVSVELREEFSLSEQDYALVVALFLTAYAIMYAGSGYVVDRLGTRRGFAVFILGWSMSQLLHGLAIGKWSLGLCRFLLGLFEPGNFPAAAKAVAEWFPASKRALGVGIFNAGATLGSSLAPPLVAYLALHYGWRSAFIFTGCLGLGWLVPWLILYQPPQSNRWLREDEYAVLKDQIPRLDAVLPVQGTALGWRQVIRMRECYSLMLARFFTDPVIYFVIFWLPEYLGKERGFDLAMVGKYAWIPFIFGDVGYIWGGWLSGFLINSGLCLAKARKRVMLVGAALMPAAILAPFVPRAWMAIAATCAVTLGHAVWASNLLTLPTDLFRGSEVGKSTGFSGMAGAIGGILATLGTGWIVQRLSYAPVFLMAGLMHPLGIFLIYRLLPDHYFKPRNGA